MTYERDVTIVRNVCYIIVRTRCQCEASIYLPSYSIFRLAIHQNHSYAERHLAGSTGWEGKGKGKEGRQRSRARTVTSAVII